MKGLDYTALVIVIIGAINWLLIGLFKFDLVAFIFGNLTWLSRIIYVLVGICGLYLCTFLEESKTEARTERMIKESCSTQVFSKYLSAAAPSTYTAFVHYKAIKIFS